MVKSAVELAKGVAPIVRSGALRPMSPAKLARMGVAAVRWDVTPGMAIAMTARRYPDRTAIIDDAGSVTYRRLDEEIDALARAMLVRGIDDKAKVAILCRNHRGFLHAVAAAGRVGADQVLVNTGLSGDQLATVLREQRVDVLVADSEFTTAAGIEGIQLIQAWSNEGYPRLRDGVPTIDELIARDTEHRLPFRPRVAHSIILTSGTTGAPKGALRTNPRNPMPGAALLSRIPFRAGSTDLVCAPIFHSWGFGALISSIAMGCTVVLQRNFLAREALHAIEAHRVRTLIVVPIMLSRIIDASADTDTDTSSLDVIAACGSAIAAPVVRETLRRFGPVLYNIYGSTEVSFATIATPDELAAHPTTSGRAPLGTTIAILDPAGRPVSAGAVGEIFVGNGMLFDGYTRQGAGKKVVDGLMATGDLGRIGADGLLFLDGRADDMVVSGGENVYPNEVEQVIAEIEGVAEVAVIGVPDVEFGHRLAAFVVRQDPRSATVTAEAVTAVVKQRLARFSVPREVRFVDALPRNTTGKVVPRLLREIVEADEVQ
ncbi:AMP-binding protein [Antrihabitans cavernicola]|uniref:AMP-binding protein n=1 Tax=Antrihabitans cavernicola TaxID=2495913 RepID=A0A5A7SDK4_9NOCA|nr:AMP-binding protein [Spelaeibacter cavernicola]KAA0022291.1 AMP-binding protein [Spelaeibacter cavernicola]